MLTPKTFSSRVLALDSLRTIRISYLSQRIISIVLPVTRSFEVIARIQSNHDRVFIVVHGNRPTSGNCHHGVNVYQHPQGPGTRLRAGSIICRNLLVD